MTFNYVNADKRRSPVIGRGAVGKLDAGTGGSRTLGCVPNVRTAPTTPASFCRRRNVAENVSLAGKLV